MTYTTYTCGEDGVTVTGFINLPETTEKTDKIYENNNQYIGHHSIKDSDG